ncbi:MAG: hypothetical protein IT423_20570 [Pirellulaceae bacterium]|nr:hypothetical protein [Pirellulaceae bacterium]
MRRLLIVPIVHSQQDLGSLQQAASELKREVMTGERYAHALDVIVRFWKDVQSVFVSMTMDYGSVKVYQDGLPNSGDPTARIEHQVVDELARAGSENHRLVKWLIEQGSTLIGTESPELLLQEYAAVRKSLTLGFHAAVAAEASPAELTNTPSLLEQRDRYIAARIDSTLDSGQCGIIFLGMMHRVDRYLPETIEAEYPCGYPRSDTRIVIHGH